CQLNYREKKEFFKFYLLFKGEISGDEIHKMADAILRILGADEKDEGSKAIISQFLNQFTGGENGIIKKEDFIQTVLRDDGLLMLISPFYGS
ncbi:unnamed protein product, partial [Didymodactylos carnosus]